MKKFLGYAAIAAVAAFGIVFANSRSSDLALSTLQIQNVEALSQYESDPNISYGYELMPCYEKVKINGKIYEKEVGARCQPVNPSGECRRSWQWGKCA